MVHAEEPAFLSCTGSAGSGSSRFAVQHAPEGGARKAAPNPSETFLVDVPAPGAPDAGWPSSFGQVADVAFEPDGRHAWVFHRGSRIWTADSFDGGALRRVTRDAPIPENTVARVFDVWKNNADVRRGGTLHAPRVDPRTGRRRVDRRRGAAPGDSIRRRDGRARRGVRRETRAGERRRRILHAHRRVAVAEDNSFWVADGYCASRIARFDASGAYVGEWSEGETNEASTNASSYATSSYSATPSCCDAARPSRWTAVARDSSSRIANARGSSCIARTEASSARTTSPRTVKCTASRCYVRRIRACTVSTRCVGARDPTVVRGAVRLVALVRGRSERRRHHRALGPPGVTAPHMLDVVSGGVGGTAAFGRGISLLVAETRPNVGDANLRRAWLGDAAARAIAEDASRRRRHATPRRRAREDGPGFGTRRRRPRARVEARNGGGGEGDENRREGERTVNRVRGDADTDARSYDDDDDDADEDRVRLPAPQHGGGGGGILPGGGLVVERGSMEGVASGRSPLAAAAAAAAAAMVVACAIAREDAEEARGGGWGSRG